MNLIDKGVKIDNVPSVLKELSYVGIGAQMMGFIGFPTETHEEAYETFTFLDKNRDHWVLAGIGDFVLTSGAIVAKAGEILEREAISCYEGDDIVRTNYWIENGRIMSSG